MKLFLNYFGHVKQICHSWLLFDLCMQAWVFTCEQHLGLLYDESVWLSEEWVSLQEMSSKVHLHPVEEHQVWSCETEEGTHESSVKFKTIVSLK